MGNVLRLIKNSPAAEPPPSPKALSQRQIKWLAVFALLVLGGVARFTALSTPRSVVFDEVHFGKFTSAYCCTRIGFFDIHPPHAKLMIGLSAFLSGADGKFPFNSIGDKYPANFPAFGFRFVPALSGTAMAVLFFWVLTLMGVSVPFAFLGGLAVALDNALVLQSRVIALEGVLISSSLAALGCYLKALHDRRMRMLWLALCGFFAAFAVGTKFTGLAIVALIGLHFLYDARKDISKAGIRSRLVELVVMVIPFLTVYLLGWLAHFVVLKTPGSDVPFYRLSGDFFPDLFLVHKTMLAANYGLKQTHPDSSQWWSWPLMKVPPFYWTGNNRNIYLFGNPMVWWGGTLLFFTALWSRIRFTLNSNRKKRQKESASGLKFLLVGYCLALLPFMGIPRVLFMYHYFTALLFSLAFGILWWDRKRKWSWEEKKGRYLFLGLGTGLAISFLLISPITYGYHAGTWGSYLVDTIRSWR